jgi:hypothetical protein
MEERVASLEKAIEASIKDHLKRLPWRTFSVAAVAHQLAKEVVACSRTDKRGRDFAPDQYTLSIHPRETGELQSSPPVVQKELAVDLQKALHNANFHLAREPHITLATDPTLPTGEVRVIAWHSSDPSEFEKAVPIQPVTAEDQQIPRAFLVVQGRRHFPLNKEIIAIGRLPENDLVLNDRHVSRRHAQLRAEKGHYRIIDLQSTAGTRVNGRPIKEKVLRPGDVITLARVELIYGEDPGGPPDATPPYTPPFWPDKDRDLVTPLDLRSIRNNNLITLTGEESPEDKSPTSKL